MRKKEAITLIEKLKNIEKSIEIHNKNNEKIIKLNDNLDKLNDLKIAQLNSNLEQLNDLFKILPSMLSTINNIQESFKKDNEIKQQTNIKVDKLIEEVNYANKRLEN